MKYFVTFFHCQIINGYYVSTFTFTSRYGNFTNDEVKAAISEMLTKQDNFWRGELIIKEIVRVTKREYDRITSKTK